MEALPHDVPTILVVSPASSSDVVVATEPGAHSRPDIDDIGELFSPPQTLEELSLPASPSSSSSPDPPAQALAASMRRASRTTSTTRAGNTSAQAQIDTTAHTASRPRALRRSSSLPTTPTAPTIATAGANDDSADDERPSLYARVRTFLGHGNPVRRRLVHTIFSLIIYLSQIVVSAVFIALTQTRWKSHSSKSRGQSEWDACDKPLGSMMIVWLVRCIIGVALAIWAFQRSVMQDRRVAEERATRQRERRARRRTTQLALDRQENSSAAAQSSSTFLSPTQTSLAAANTASGSGITEASPNGNGNGNGNANGERQRTGWDKAYDRSISITSLLVISHFCITNVLIFASTKSCRVSSPHLWWSTFAMLCLTYIIILEVLIIGFTIFVIMPIIFIGLNILLIMTGHRPISARQMIDPGHINPETPKMSQKLVDKIPLVLYIPAPEPPVTKADTEKAKGEAKTSEPIAVDETNEAQVASTSMLQPPSPSTPLPQSGFSYPPESSLNSQIDVITVPPRAATSASGQATSGSSSSSAALNPNADVPSASTLPRPNPRFAFFRRKRRAPAPVASSALPSSSQKSPMPTGPDGDIEAQNREGLADEADEAGNHDGEEDEYEGEWEDRYEKSSLPFVRLENNRAVCAICLMDFDEPRKRQRRETGGANKNKEKRKSSPKKKDAGAASTSPVGDVDGIREIGMSEAITSDSDPAKGAAADANETTEPEPLRLLECGHVFHKSCLDPWLTGVSGRCPTCQRKVEIVPKGKKRRPNSPS